ncbi:SDR family oxidoreductase [Gammaproteobacteria bacterium]|nr:SDR family oxidoreductase [Gammaproteobacteria bacterium]
MTIVLLFGSDTNLFFGVSYPSPSIWEIKVALENKRSLEKKIAIVVGGGQTVGETIGNGRATAILFAREGARVAVVDRLLSSAEETVKMIVAEGFEAFAYELDVRDEDGIKNLVSTVMQKWGRIDILHNNVGVSIAGQDTSVEKITSEGFDNMVAINLRSMVLTSKHALPHMREAGSGVIINISSLAAIKPFPLIGYKTTKAAVIALTEQLAAGNARYGIRANVILPGLMNTPMAVEGRVQSGKPRDEVIAERDRLVPLGRKMGSAWDVAHAAAFLASDKAGYITGISLPVDGGLSIV